MSTLDVSPADRVIVALDCPRDKAFSIADALEGSAAWLKVGMTLYYREGPSIVTAFKERGFRVFLDLKFYDIPHQVEGAAASAVLSGADMFTMHTSGGVEMLCAGVQSAERTAREAGVAVPVSLGVTVLTSMDAQTLSECGVTRDIKTQVCELARLTAKAHTTGVVASPQEASMLREILGPDAYIVTPGVRPVGSAKGDQKRVATPAEALRAGASHLVIGRPITQASDPRAAYQAIVDEIEEVLA